MKRTVGIIMIVLFGLPMVYFNIIGVYWVGAIFGFFVGAGIVLSAQREFAIISSELKEENGTFRLHVTVKNKQKRATLIWFVANIHYRGPAWDWLTVPTLCWIHTARVNWWHWFNCRWRMRDSRISHGRL